MDEALLNTKTTKGENESDAAEFGNDKGRRWMWRC
jgi:hypothetical protein